mmetsp:Transcript_9685/g.29524  ORF Transcript_9685/g.29524 Transcript_9685/m.29524 type:complete len:141 (+) Transcript_9685:590-1012(+)
MNLTARYVRPDFAEISQRLLAFKTYAKHLNGEQMFRAVSEIVHQDMKIDSHHLIGLSRDSCATNGVACRSLQLLYPNALDILCVSHTLQHTGQHFALDAVEEFLGPWLALSSHAQLVACRKDSFRFVAKFCVVRACVFSA